MYAQRAFVGKAHNRQEQTANASGVESPGVQEPLESKHPQKGGICLRSWGKAATAQESGLTTETLNTEKA